MKQFLQISSNQITAYVPEEEHFHLMSEIVISAVETNYSLVRGENNEREVAKYPKTETFKFFATPEALKIIRDRIDQELEFQGKLLKIHNGK